MGGKKDRAKGAARVGGDGMSGEGPGGLLTQTAVCDSVPATRLLKHTGPHTGTTTLRYIARCVVGRHAGNARIYAELERPDPRAGVHLITAAPEDSACGHCGAWMRVMEGEGILPHHPYDLVTLSI